jgi:hypothetical protein
VDERRAALEDRLAALAGDLADAEAAVRVLPGLLGAERPRLWFVGLQSPAEARGTGGVVGTHVYLAADDGRLRLLGTGSNSAFAPLDQLPASFPPEFESRYGQDPRLFVNSNLSPHFPFAATLWQAFSAQVRPRPVEVAAALDVVSLGQLVTATGPVTLPDGRRLTPQRAVAFGLSGVYTAYPDPAVRERYQERVARAIFGALTGPDVDGAALVRAVATIVAERRFLLWSADEAEQARIDALPVAHRLTPPADAPDAPYAAVVVNNIGASKLDAFLERDVEYRVGRCPDNAGRVSSQVAVTLTSAIPRGADLEPYVVAGTADGPGGPRSLTQVQVHLAPGAVATEVRLDGEPVGAFPFVEEGRPSVALDVLLRPRRPTTVTVAVREAMSDEPAQAPAQPLARPGTTRIVDEPCPAASPQPTSSQPTGWSAPRPTPTLAAMSSVEGARP